MRAKQFALAAVAATLVSSVAVAQDASVAVKDGGIKAAGWMGQIDSSEAAKGMKQTDAKIEKMGSGVHVTTGPQGVYWESKAMATGNYTVKAKFDETKYMNLNDHPHPYGIFIAGNDMGTPNQSYLYCAAYGNGNFIIRGFGGAATTFRLNGRGEPHAAVNKAAGKDQPVSQEIAVSVKGDKIECAINGQVVGSYDKAAAVGAGKLKSTDGVFGLRFGHNTEAHVSGLTMTKN